VRLVEAERGEALALVGDVTRGSEQRDAVSRVVERWGRLDVLFANAGVPQWPTAVEEVDEATFDRIMAVNVKGVFLGVQAAVPSMKRQGSGVILVTASTSAIRPRPRVQCYSASKGAVITMVKSLALELAPSGIRVLALAPVATDTPMLRTFMGKTAVDDEGRARYVATIPLGRLNTPDDLAKAAVFLVSDDAAMMTGTCVEVDGGRCV
jgi:3-oxoacyl-[acyl-carrier protein] reductase